MTDGGTFTSFHATVTRSLDFPEHAILHGHLVRLREDHTVTSTDLILPMEVLGPAPPP